MKPTSLLTAAVAVACLALPASAAAGTITSDGSTVTFTGTSAAEDVLVDIDFDGNATFSGDATAGAGCQPDGNGFVVCALGAGGLATMTINAGDGNDRIRSLITDPIPTRALRANLGAGNDTFGGQDAAEVVDGGPGDDDITTYGGADELLGGDGTDKLNSGHGADVLRGGAGNDVLSPDIMGQRGADVIDGGPGVDAVDDWVPDGDPATAAPATVTLDGRANDGFAREGDNVIAVEAIKAGSALVFTGDGGANRAVSAEVGGPSTLRGEGGADILHAGDARDRLDGGAGADELQGGFGSDTIVPGPGRDAVSADRPGRCNEMHCDLSPGLSADTVEARDGEVDQIACGPGADTVRADRADVVADDCETVVRSGGGGATAACVVPKLRGLQLGAAKRRLTRAGCTVKVKRAVHRRVKRGRVIRASVKPGRRLAGGARVTITVSRGRAAAAAAGVKFKKMKLAVSITGTEVVDWTWRSAHFDDPEETWDSGSGTQTFGFSTRKPILFHAYMQSGRVNGKRIDDFGMGAARLPKLRASLRRDHEWYAHQGPPVCEGGPKYCPDDGIDEQPVFQCPSLRPKVAIRQLVYTGDVAYLEIERPVQPWKNCPPDHVGGPGPFDLDPPRAVELIKAKQRRIGRLRRGQSVTFKRDEEWGRSDADLFTECPAKLEPEPGFKWCQTLHVTTKVRRVR